MVALAVQQQGQEELVSGPSGQSFPGIADQDRLSKLCRGVVVPTLVHVEQGQGTQPAGLDLGRCESLREDLPGLGAIPGVDQREAVVFIDVALGNPARLLLEGSHIVRKGLLALVQLAAGGCQVDQRTGAGGLDTDNLLELFHSLLEAPVPHQKTAEVVTRQRVIRIGGQVDLVRPNRIFHRPDAPAVGCFDEQTLAFRDPARQPQRLLEVLFALGRFRKDAAAISRSEGRVSHRKIGVAVQRRVVEVDCLEVFALAPQVLTLRIQPERLQRGGRHLGKRTSVLPGGDEGFAQVPANSRRNPAQSADDLILFGGAFQVSP